MSRRGSILTLGLLVIAMEGHAQETSSWLDIGTARMRYADSIDANALSASAYLRRQTSRMALYGSGSMSRLETSWSGSGSASGVVRNAFSRGLSAELAATAGGSSHSDGARTGQLVGTVRFRMEGTTAGVWIGGGVGQAWDGSWRLTRQGDAGTWMALGPAAASLSLAPTSVGDSVTYTDISAIVQRGASGWDTDASLGVRIGNAIPSLPSNRKVWGGVSGTRWVSTTVGVQVALGTYPVDFTQGFPGGQYVSLSLRIAPRRSAPMPLALAGQPGPGNTDVRTFQVLRVGRDSVRITVLAPRARSIDIMGDFTLWTPRSLTSSSSGLFQLTVAVAAGTHQLNVRVDGGPWLVPPGLTPLKDEFGGSIGLLDVP